MKKYEEYRDSGVEWIGEIPEHWEYRKMKFLFIDISQKNKPNEVLLSVTQNQGVVPRNWVENRMVMPSGNLESFKYIKKGDFCISLRSFEGGLEYCHHDGIVSPAYTVLKGVFTHFPLFYKYLFKSQIFIDEMQLSIVGIREGKNISYELLKYSHIPIPLQEQKAIADFLDDKCAKVDALVSVKEQQIALLKERRQAVIHQAVTKGLDSNVERKDSGIDWIGDIPKHWITLKVKYNFILSGGGTPSKENNSYWNGNIPWVSPKDMKSLYINRTEDLITEDAIKNSSVKLISKGSLLMVVRSGILQRTIPVCFANIPLTINQDIKAITANGAIGITFFYYFIKGTESFLLKDWVKDGATVESIEIPYFLNYYVPIPPIAEQEDIVSYLEAQTSKIDQAIVQKQEQILKLKEYKQSLINEVVTGKLKVS